METFGILGNGNTTEVTQFQLMSTTSSTDSSPLSDIASKFLLELVSIPVLSPDAGEVKCWGNGT